MIEFVKDHGGWFGLLAVFLPLAYAWRRHAISDLKEALDDPHHRARLTDSRKSDWHAGYFAALEDLTGWADRFYGPRKLGARAFGRCLQLAYAYPVLAALLAWMVANVHAPGGYPLFPDLDDAFGRVWRAGVLCATAVVFWMYFQKPQKVISYIKGSLRKICQRCNKGDYFLCKRIHFLAIAFIGALPFVVALALSGYLAGTGAYAYVGAFAFAGMFVLFGNLTLAFPAVLAFAITFALPHNMETAILMFFFWLFLPLANAVADWLSVAATRRFLGAVRDNRPRLWGILGLMLFDFAVGAACLAVLLALLTQGLDLWAYSHPETVPMDWRDYWATARADPWQGMALWLMALTTLLPTIIHAVMGLSAVISHKSRLNRVALQELDEAITRGGPRAADKTTVAKGMVAADIYGFAIGLVFVVLPLFLIGGSLWRVFLS